MGTRQSAAQGVRATSVLYGSWHTRRFCESSSIYILVLHNGRRCYHQSYLVEQTTYVVLNVCILNSQRVLHFIDREGIRFMGSNNFNFLNYSSNCLKILEVPVPNETNQEHLWLVTLGVWQISFRSEKSVQELNWGHFTCSNLPLSCSWRFLSAIKRHFPLEEIVA